MSIDMTVKNHLPECTNSAGSCCPWMGDCDCQCGCEELRRVENRIIEAAIDAVRRVANDAWEYDGSGPDLADIITALQDLRTPISR